MPYKATCIKPLTLQIYDRIKNGFPRSPITVSICNGYKLKKIISKKAVSKAWYHYHKLQLFPSKMVTGQKKQLAVKAVIIRAIKHCNCTESEVVGASDGFVDGVGTGGIDGGGGAEPFSTNWNAKSFPLFSLAATAKGSCLITPSRVIFPEKK